MVAAVNQRQWAQRVELWRPLGARRVDALVGKHALVPLSLLASDLEAISRIAVAAPSEEAP